MPRKHALTLDPSKKTSPSQSADSPSLLSFMLLSDTQIETLIQSSSEKEDEEPSSETINYLIEYHFKYKNDILLQSSKTVNLQDSTFFFFESHSTKIIH